MIKPRRLPARSVVAEFAGLRETSLYVVRIGRVLEVLLVTRNASDTGQVVVIVDVAVATLTRRNRVRSG